MFIKLSSLNKKTMGINKTNCLGKSQKLKQHLGRNFHSLFLKFLMCHQPLWIIDGMISWKGNNPQQTQGDLNHITWQKYFPLVFFTFYGPEELAKYESTYTYVLWRKSAYFYLNLDKHNGDQRLYTTAGQEISNKYRCFYSL